MQCIPPHSADSLVQLSVLEPEISNVTNTTFDVSFCGINDCPSNIVNSNTKKPLMSTVIFKIKF